MKKKSLIKLITVGTILAIVGTVLIIVGSTMGGSCYGYRENWTSTRKRFTENITAIKCDLDTCNLNIVHHNNESVIVNYPESSARENTITVINGVLTINSEFKKTKYDSSDFPTTFIRVPNDWTGALSIETNAGEITISDGTYGNLSIDTDAEVINIGDAAFRSVTLNVDAGTVTAENLTCSSLACDVDAGSVKIEKLTCPNIKLNVGAGSLKACLAGSKDDYVATCSVILGSCNISSGGSGANILKVNVKAGSAEITFTG